MKKIILLFIAFVILISITIILNKIYAFELPIIGISAVSGIVFLYISTRSKKKDNAE